MMDHWFAISDESLINYDFLFPQIQKQIALQDQIRALDRTCKEMEEEEQRAMDDLLQRSKTYSSICYLAPK